MSKKSIKVNFFYQSTYQILLIISPLITSPYISRVLGAENIGTYSYYYSIAYYFGIFAILGISNYGNRSIAKCNGNKTKQYELFCEIFSMQAVSGFLVLLAYLSFVFLFSREMYVSPLIQIFYVLSICLDISWFYFGIEEFKTTVTRSIIIRVLTIISIFCFVNNSNDLSKYTFIMAFGSLASSAILWFNLPKILRKPVFQFSNVKKHILPNLTLFIPVISLAVFHYMDKIMLGYFSNMEELGYYTNADKIINIPMGLINGLGVVMLPRISTLSTGNAWDKINTYVQKSLAFSAWIGAAMCFGIMAVSEDFVPLFFGPGYEKCIELLQIFSIAVMIKAIANVLRMQYLIPAGKDKEFNISVIAAAIVNLLFNLFFIPKFGALGAIYGTLIAETVVLILYFYFSSKKLSISKSIRNAFIFAICGLFMYYILGNIKLLIPFQSYTIRLLIELISGATIYCFLTGIILLVIDKEILKELLLFKRKRK